MAEREAVGASISASAVGEYLYCARAYGLRRVTATAAEPAAAAWQAQGQAGAGWRAVTALLRQRLRVREGQLAGGVLAHQRHARGIELGRWLLIIGLGLLLAGLLAGLVLGPA